MENGKIEDNDSSKLTNEIKNSIEKQKNEEYIYDAEHKLTGKSQKELESPIITSFITISVLLIAASVVWGIFFDHGLITVPSKQYLTNVPTGAQISEEENSMKLSAKNLNLKLKTSPGSGNAKMIIWDSNLEDGDIVQIFVDGKPLHNAFELTNSPAAFSVPVPSTVTIKGVKDVLGGISYGVKFPQDKLAIFNIVPVGGVNTYVLTPKL